MKRTAAALVKVATAAALTLVLSLPASATVGDAPQGDADTEVNVPDRTEQRTSKGL